MIEGKTEVAKTIVVFAEDSDDPKALSVCVLYQEDSKKDEAFEMAKSVQQSLKLARMLCAQVGLANDEPDIVRNAYDRLLKATAKDKDGEVKAMLGPPVALCAARVIADLERDLEVMQTRARTFEMMVEYMGKQDA